MKTRKVKSRLLGLASLLASQNIFAQFDELPSPPPPAPPANFDEFPSPPKPFTDNGNSAQEEPAETTGTAGKSASILTKKKKNNFNQSRPEDITNEKFPETIESFDFVNADLTDVIKLISELTGKNFIIDSGVRGKITIVAPSKITVAEAYKAFLSALSMNGFTVVPSGNFLKVKNARNAQRDSIETYPDKYYPNTDQMITKIIHLKHISAEQVNRELRLLQSKDGDMVPYAATNSIIISDFGSNIDRVMKIINQLDVPGFEEQLEVVPIKYAKAKDMSDLIDKIVNKGEKKQSGPPGSFSAGVPRFSRSSSGGAQGQQGNSYFMAIPDDRTNSIIVVGNKSGIDRIKKLIGQLDTKIRIEESGNVHVYYVKFGDADKIAETLKGVTKDAGPKASAPGGAGGGFPSLGAGTSQNVEIFGGDVKIMADKGTNSLIITASKTDYDTVLNILKKLDISRDQVFVEAIIMEMANSDGLNVQTGYYQYPDSGYGKVGFNGGLNLQELLSPTGGAGAVLGFGSNKMVEVTNPVDNKTLKVPNLVGFISFLKKVTKGNILSTPQVTALDNQEAEIEVGDSVATSVSSTTQQGVTVQTPTFSDATIYLKIKPIINPSNEAVRMEIEQKVAQLSPGTATPKALQDTTQPLQKRRVKTTIVVNNGDTAIIGGLMKDQETETTSKVPLLGDIPIIGWLFKSQARSKDKVNMLVFLTPTIIRSPQDNNTIVGKKLEQRLDFIKSQGGRDPWGKTIDEIQKKTAYDATKAETILDTPNENKEESSENKN